MKKILISPRFKYDKNFSLIHIQTSWSDFLLERGYLPIVPFFHTNIASLDQAFEDARKYVDEASGVIFQGGRDIDPYLYGQENQGAVDTNLFNDWFDYALVSYAIEQNIPVFGVCRGMQMINVVRGGTLIQDIDHSLVTHRKFLDPDIDPKKAGYKDVDFGKMHSVDLVSSGVLREVLEFDIIDVNSIHHQAIQNLGNSLVAEAVTEDGLIEAISWKEKNLLGVQWHPETDFADPNQVKIVEKWLEWVENN